MTNRYYYINKKGVSGDIVYIDYNKINSKSFDVTPKNTVNYDGIEVNKLVIIKQSLIEKLLKRKIKRKLELYLKFIIDIMDNDDGTSDSLREALNDLTRFKGIVDHKYRLYLDNKFIDILLKKIDLIEYELNNRILNIKEAEKEIEHTSRRRR